MKLCNSTIATAKDENRKKYLQVQKAEGRTIMPLRRDRDRSNDAAEPEWAPKKKEFHNKSDAGAPTPGRRDGLVIKIFEWAVTKRAYSAMILQYRQLWQRFTPAVKTKKK